MPLINLVVVLVIVGVALYLINRYIPMASSIKTIRICLPRRKEDDNTGTRLQRQVERLSGLDRNDWIRVRGIW